MTGPVRRLRVPGSAVPGSAVTGSAVTGSAVTGSAVTGLAVTVAAGLLVTSCSTTGLYEPTPIPSPAAAATRTPEGTTSPSTNPTTNPTTSPTTNPATGPSVLPSNPDVTATNCLQSYAPPARLPAAGHMPAGSTMSRIQSRGRLVAGVSADTLLLGARNPITGRIEGFDIDMVRAVAKAIFGDPSRVQLRVITAAQRAPALENGSVDIVARAMTITCKRWNDVAFSSEYYRSGQKVLVRRGERTKDGRPIARVQDLVGKKVCAPRGTSAMDSLRTFAGLVPVGADTHTGCLVLFQEGQVDAIAGDATVLAGLAAQDPYAQVVKAPAFTVEPYGLAVKKENVDLVQFVNGVLEQLRADGRWAASYTRWLALALGPTPGPPRPVYGRSL